MNILKSVKNAAICIASVLYGLLLYIWYLLLLFVSFVLDKTHKTIR